MSVLQNIVSMVLVFAGAGFMLIGSIGLVRLPDFYTRTHASGKIDTLGIMLLLGGLAVHEGFTLNTAKLVLVIVFVAAANPVGAHALARSARRSGLKPWCRPEPGEAEQK